MKSIFGKIVAFVMAIGFVFACASCSGGGDNSQGGGESLDTSKSITLKIESAAPLKQGYISLLRTEKEGSQLYNQALFTKKVVDGFKAKYPNIKLQFIENGWGEALYRNQQVYIKDHIKNNTKYPVDVMIGESYMGYFAKNGVFAELDGAKFSDVVEGSYADTVVNGKMYCVPMCTGILGLQYNENILKEAGIAEDKYVPGTWDELLENCRLVSEYAKANGKEYGGIMMNNVACMSGAFRALPFMRQAGGDFLDDNGNLTLDSEANRTAFAYLRNLAKYSYSEALTVESEDTLQYYFTNKGYAAYMIEGQWSMSSAPEYIKSAALPAKDASSTVKGNCYIGNLTFGIAKASENYAAASAFLEYITSDEVQSWFYELDGRLAVNKKTLAKEETRLVHPNINPYIDALLAGGFEGGMACFTKNASDIWDKWGIFYNGVLRGEGDIAALCEQVQKDISAKM